MTTMNPPCRQPLPDSQPLATSEPIELFINKLEVGRRTGMRPRTIDAWMKRGLLPYYKLGRSVRFKWSEVEAHLARTFLVARKGRER